MECVIKGSNVQSESIEKVRKSGIEAIIAGIEAEGLLCLYVLLPCLKYIIVRDRLICLCLL